MALRFPAMLLELSCRESSGKVVAEMANLEPGLLCEANSVENAVRRRKLRAEVFVVLTWGCRAWHMQGEVHATASSTRGTGSPACRTNPDGTQDHHMECQPLNKCEPEIYTADVVMSQENRPKMGTMTALRNWMVLNPPPWRHGVSATMLPAKDINSIKRVDIAVNHIAGVRTSGRSMDEYERSILDVELLKAVAPATDRSLHAGESASCCLM